MKIKTLFVLATLAWALVPPGSTVALAANDQQPAGASASARADVVVYGGTPAGVMAAVAAARHGCTVALVDINNHVGGVVSGGLCDSDMGDRKTVGGLSAEFFRRVAKYYSDTYGPTSRQFAHSENAVRFEPRIAEKIFNDMIQEQQPRITVWKHCRFKSAALDGNRVASLTADSLNDGKVLTFTGGVFIDASYEGDLMAGAHVPYAVGREGRQQYGESIAGVGVGPDKGQPDHLLMAYNYRLSLSSNPNNRVLFPKPENYDRDTWSKIYGPRIISGKVTNFGNILWPDIDRKAGPNDTFDLNSPDLEGGSTNYPDGDWATRDRIALRHRDYILSLCYYLQNDPELPQSWRDQAKNWGLTRDAFTDNGSFPFQLYIREARRMIGAYVLHQDDLTQNRYKPDGICEGSYGTDCHTVRFLMIDGKRVQDHTTHLALNDYDIPYGCLVPRDKPVNLLVPVCISASHVAYCSVRMEPVYMMLGHAAGDAAYLAISGHTSVQNVSVPRLRELLVAEGAILDDAYQPPIKISFTPSHPKPGETVHFHAEQNGLKSPLKQIWWDFDGAGAVGAQGPGADHAFPLEKTYHVSLVVEDNEGRRRMVFADVPVGAATDRDVIIDDLDAHMEGRWEPAYPILPSHPDKRYSDVFLDGGLSYDMVIRGTKEKARALFQPILPRAGRYLICFGYRPSPHLADNLTVTICCNGQKTTQVINEKTKESPFPFVSLGEFHCDAGNGSWVAFDNANTKGHIGVDAVRWVWLGE